MTLEVITADYNVTGGTLQIHIETKCLIFCVEQNNRLEVEKDAEMYII